MLDAVARRWPSCVEWALCVSAWTVGHGSIVATQAQAQSGFVGSFSGPDAIAQLSSGNASIRIRAASFLARNGVPAHAIKALVQALERERNPVVIRAIAESLARRGDSRAARALATAFREADVQTLPALADALAAVGGSHALAELADALAQTPRRNVASRALLRAGVVAIPFLVRALHVDESRLAAIRLLGELKSHTATPELVSWAQDSDPEIREESIRALGSIGDERAAYVVLRALQDSSGEVVIAAISALSSVGSPAHVDRLLDVLRGSDARRRRLALNSLVALSPEAAIPVIRGELEARPGDARDIAELVMHHQHAAFLEIYETLMRRGVYSARVADAIAEIGTPAALRALLRNANRTNPNPDLARSIAIGLRRGISFSTELKSAAWSFLRKRGPGDRMLVFRALARDPAVRDVLVRRLRADSAQQRAVAANAMALYGSSENTFPLGTALKKERSERAFVAIAMSMAALGGAADASSLWRWLRPWSTVGAAMILASVSAPRWSARQARRLGRLLRANLRHPRPSVRAQACWALANVREKRAWRAIARLLDDDHADVRTSAARALRVLQVPAANLLLRARWRVEKEAKVRAQLQSPGAPLPRGPLHFQAMGHSVLRVRVRAASEQLRGRELPVDIVLSDGRWIQTHTLTGGELILAGLPDSVVDVRVGLGGASR